MPNKTYKLKPPNISEHLVCHFIRGYVDGDGAITCYEDNYGKVFRIKIVGTEHILNFIKEFIEKNEVAHITKYYKRRETDRVSCLDFGGNYQVKNFLDLIYNEATIYLERKYKRYIELCDIIHSRL